MNADKFGQTHNSESGWYKMEFEKTKGGFLRRLSIINDRERMPLLSAEVERHCALCVVS